MNDEPIESTARGVQLRIHAVPRASRTEVAGRHGNSIRVRLTSAPVDGAANEELLRYLAKRLQVPRAAVHLSAGERSRRKLVLVTGAGLDQVRMNLGVDHTPVPESPDA